MNVRTLFFLVFAASGTLLVSAEETHKLAPLQQAPDGLSKKITPLLNPNGFRISGPKGAVCDVWLAKSVPIIPGFKPALSVKYPFAPGQLLGALRVAKGSGFTDFRGQNIATGLYTLRYGQQPEDGNHIGTSETADFLLALPAKMDTDPKPIAGPDKLSEQSAKSVSSTHPAIFSLLPSEKPPKKATLNYEDDREFWIVTLTISGIAQDKKIKVPLRFVAIGRAQE